MVISPGIFLDAIGGFAEDGFLDLFSQVDVSALEGLIRTTNAEEWGTPGALLRLDEFVFPLRSRRLPKHSLGELDWWLGNALMATEPIADPLLNCYVSSMRMYTQAHFPGDLELTQLALAVQFESLKKLGFYHRMGCLKFTMWVHGLSCGSEDAKRRLILHAFLLLATCVVDLGETSRSALQYDPDWKFGSFAQRSVSPEANKLLSGAVRAVAGPDGTVAAMLKSLCDEVFVDKRNLGTAP